MTGRLPLEGLPKAHHEISQISEVSQITEVSQFSQISQFSQVVKTMEETIKDEKLLTFY